VIMGECCGSLLEGRQIESPVASSGTIHVDPSRLGPSVKSGATNPESITRDVSMTPMAMFRNPLHVSKFNLAVFEILKSVISNLFLL
jgi:hypothetical protein